MPVIFSNKSKTFPTNWTIIKKKFRSLDLKKTLLNRFFRWKLQMLKKVFRTNLLESNKKWKDTSTFKRLKTAGFSSKLLLLKAKRQLCNNSFWGFKEELQSCKCKLVMTVNDMQNGTSLKDRMIYFLHIFRKNVNHKFIRYTISFIRN